MSTELAIQEPKSEVAVIFGKITDGLKAFEDRKETFNELAKEAAQIKKTTVEDRAPLKKAIEVRKKIKAARVQVEKEGKALRNPLTNVNKEISAKENELVDIISPAENDMQAIEDWYAAEDDRIKREDEEKEKARIQARIDRLAAYGYQIDYNMLISLSDQDFDRIVEDARVEHEKEEKAKSEREEAERKQKEKDEADRKELQALREKQAEADRILREREEEIARKEAAIKRQEEEAAERAEDERLLAEKRKEDEMKKVRFEPRKAQLLEMGFVLQGVDFSLKDTWSCYWEQVFNMSDEEWPEYIKDINGAIQRHRERLEHEAKQREADLEKARLEGIEQAKMEAKRNEEAEAQRLAEASDKDKFALIIGYYENIPKIEPRSAKHKKLYVDVVELNAKIIAHIKSKV